MARTAAWLVFLFLVLGVSPASAEIVRFANGRTLAVESCRFDGESAVLRLPGGGELRVPREMVVELLPDEAPPARQAALEALAVSPARRRPLAPEAIAALVDDVARRVGLDRRLAHALVGAESNYEPFAISPKGAMGLTQLMPVIVREYRLEDPFDPEGNLDAGFRHFRRLLGRYDLGRALAAYNAGEGAVARYGGVPPYQETQQYVRRVLARLR